MSTVIVVLGVLAMVLLLIASFFFYLAFKGPNSDNEGGIVLSMLSVLTLVVSWLVFIPIFIIGLAYHINGAVMMFGGFTIVLCPFFIFVSLRTNRTYFLLINYVLEIAFFVMLMMCI